MHKNILYRTVKVSFQKPFIDGSKIQFYKSYMQRHFLSLLSEHKNVSWKCLLSELFNWSPTIYYCLVKSNHLNYLNSVWKSIRHISSVGLWTWNDEFHSSFCDWDYSVGLIDWKKILNFTSEDPGSNLNSTFLKTLYKGSWCKKKRIDDDIGTI